jgi:hypothetical protein
MRFTVEERHLTDESGRPITDPYPASFHSFQAENVDEAVQLYLAEASAELIGNVLKLPGMQGVATVRKASGVYTVQFTPTSQRDATRS